MLKYTITTQVEELRQILSLQQRNLPKNLANTDKETQGFVTVEHDITILKEMHDVHPHIIAKKDDNVVGYALSMSAKFRKDIPVLTPMFTEIDTSEKHNANYIIMGQVCVNKEYRGKGVFRGLYNKMKEEFTGKNDCIITEIDELNTRSINAHKAIGFKKLTSYILNNQTWIIVYLNL